jgi:hypothetical protein
MLSLAEWVELGLTMPFVLYQDDTGFMLNQQAIGDLRLLSKINIHLPRAWPQIAFSLGLGFATSTDNALVGAGGISGYPRLIVDFPWLLGKRLHVAANVGAVIAGTTRPCTADELAAQAAMMNMMSNGMPAPDCVKPGLGLGDHVIYGVGVSFKLSDEQKLYATTELLGSVSIGTDLETRAPLFWDIGIRRALANATYFAAAYGIGLTTGSPSHTVLATLGLVWETKPPPPADKKPTGPTIKVDLNITGLPQGTGVAVGGKEVRPPAPPVAPPPSTPSTSSTPGKPAKPPPTESVSASAEIAVPDGLVPADSSSDSSKKPPPKKK